MAFTLHKIRIFFRKKRNLLINIWNKIKASYKNDTCNKKLFIGYVLIRNQCVYSRKNESLYKVLTNLC